MLRDIEALFVIVNLTAVALGFIWRRRRQSRRSANLEHIKNLEREGKEIDDALKRMQDKEEG